MANKMIVINGLNNYGYQIIHTLLMSGTDLYVVQNTKTELTDQRLNNLIAQSEFSKKMDDKKVGSVFLNVDNNANYRAILDFTKVSIDQDRSMDLIYHMDDMIPEYMVKRKIRACPLIYIADIGYACDKVLAGMECLRLGYGISGFVIFVANLISKFNKSYQTVMIRQALTNKLLETARTHASFRFSTVKDIIQMIIKICDFFTDDVLGKYGWISNRHFIPFYLDGTPQVVISYKDFVEILRLYVDKLRVKKSFSNPRLFESSKIPSYESKSGKIRFVPEKCFKFELSSIIEEIIKDEQIYPII